MNSILNWLRPARAAQRARVIGPLVTSRKPNDYPAMSVQQSQEAREIAQRLAGVFHMDAQELMNQARKMVQGSGFSVLYLLKVWEKTANECPHWLGATKEGVSEMRVNEIKLPPQSGKTTMALTLLRGSLAGGPESVVFWVPTEAVKARFLAANLWVPGVCVAVGLQGLAMRTARVVIIDDADKHRNTPEGDLVKLAAQRTQTFHDGVVYAFSTIEEVANSMNTESKPITYSSALGGAKRIQTLAEVAINRLKTLEEPEGLVFSELNRDVMEVLKNVCGGSDQKPHAQSVCLPSGGMYIRLGDREKITVPVVANAELRYSIEQTIWELRGENVAGLSVAVSDRLQKHLDCLLNAEAARVITIIEDEKGAAMPQQQSAADLSDGDAEIIPAKSPQDLKELRDWAAQYLDQLNADMQRHQASVAELTAGGRARHASLQHKVWQLSAVGQKQTAATLFLSAVESVLDAQKGHS